VIISGELLEGTVLLFLNTNSGLHQTGERRKYINWRVDLSVVEITVNEDLSFSNVTSKIWDGMGDIIVRHGEDR